MLKNRNDIQQHGCWKKRNAQSASWLCLWSEISPGTQATPTKHSPENTPDIEPIMLKILSVLFIRKNWGKAKKNSTSMLPAVESATKNSAAETRFDTLL